MTNNYWADNPDPRHLPIRAREAWHWEAWDREQDALRDLIGSRDSGGPSTLTLMAIENPDDHDPRR